MKDTKVTVTYRINTISEAKKASVELKPLVQIGKNGLSLGLLEEIKKALKKKKLIKIKCLRYFLESIEVGGSNKEKLQNMALFLEDKLPCKVVDIKGFTITLWQT